MKILAIVGAALTLVALVFTLGYIRGMKALEKEIDEGLKRLKEEKEDPSDIP